MNLRRPELPRRSALGLLAAGPMMLPGMKVALAAPALPNADDNRGSVVRYRTQKVGEVDVFYREAGSEDAPVILLLHGFPSASQATCSATSFRN